MAGALFLNSFPDAERFRTMQPQMKIISATKAKAAPTNTALKEFVSPILASSFCVDERILGAFLND